MQLALRHRCLVALLEPAQSRAQLIVRAGKDRDPVLEEIVTDAERFEHRVSGDWLARRVLAEMEQARDSSHATVMAACPISYRAEVAGGA